MTMTDVSCGADPVQIANLTASLYKVQDLWAAENEGNGGNTGWQTREPVMAARKLGLALVPMGFGQPARYYLAGPDAATLVQGSRSSRLDASVEAINNDKAYSKKLMEQAGLPVAGVRIVDCLEEARAAFAEMRPVVVKPAYGSLYAGVTTNVDTEAKLEAAWTHARGASAGKILIEEFIPGADIRVNMAGGKVTTAYLRIGANVIGDGRRTILELVREKNRKRKTLPGLNTRQIPLDKAAEINLAAQGLSLQSVLEPGRAVVFSSIPNLNQGADWYPVTGMLHPGIVAMAEKAAAVLGPSDYWGFDILAEDFTASPADRRVIICESNTRPNILFFQTTTHGPRSDNFADFYRAASGIGRADADWPERNHHLELDGAFTEEDGEALVQAARGAGLSCDVSVQESSRIACQISGPGDHLVAWCAQPIALPGLVWNCRVSPGQPVISDLSRVLGKVGAASEIKIDGDHSFAGQVCSALSARGHEAALLENGLIEFQHEGKWHYGGAGVAGTVAQAMLGGKQISGALHLLSLQGLQRRNMVVLRRGRQEADVHRFFEAQNSPVELMFRTRKGGIVTRRAEDRRALDKLIGFAMDNSLFFATALPRPSDLVLEITLGAGHVFSALAKVPQGVSGDLAPFAGQIIALGDLVPAGILGLAQAAYAALPDLAVANVILFADPLVNRWTVSRISALPDPKELAKPDRGRALNLAQEVAEHWVLPRARIGLSSRTRLSKEYR